MCAGGINKRSFAYEFDKETPLRRLRGGGHRRFDYHNSNDRVIFLKGNVAERCVELGRYITSHEATVRETAKIYGISKSTVHKDLTDRLKKSNPELHRQVKAILDKNKSERHIRGGLATKLKYKGIKKA